jgi:acyl transferase domain-containing protein
MLSADGYCKTFDESANGYVRGEGIGVIVLKRQKEAESAHDRIYALLKSSRVNHNGPASGITVPNGAAQTELLTNALADASVAAQDVDYVEAHGTGTNLGDPIEVSALGNVYRNTHSVQHPLYIGSAKSNIGHLEAAAGIAGLMKTILMLWNQKIVPNIHFKRLNSKMSLAEMPAVIPVSLISWERGKRRRIAGVSSFGATGINAHVIVEEAAVPEPRDQSITLPKACIFVLSAKSERSLEQMVASYRA